MWTWRSDQIIELIAESERPNSGIPLLMQLIFEKDGPYFEALDVL